MSTILRDVAVRLKEEFDLVTAEIMELEGRLDMLTLKRRKIKEDLDALKGYLEAQKAAG